MTTIENVNAYSDVSGQTQTYGNSELGKDAFLKLLVTQLQYQDPLDPAKNEEFVAQLAQFSSVEQLSNANDALGSLYLAMSSMNNASMTQLLGKEVTAYGDTFHYDGEGGQTLEWEASGAASNATLTITDSTGKVVYSESIGAIEEGRGSMEWDGSTIGGTAAEGEYSFSVTAVGEDGVEIATLVTGEIDGMDFSSGSPVPSINGVDIELGDIIDVRIPGAAEDDADANADEEGGATSARRSRR